MGGDNLDLVDVHTVQRAKRPQHGGIGDRHANALAHQIGGCVHRVRAKGRNGKWVFLHGHGDDFKRCAPINGSGGVVGG